MQLNSFTIFTSFRLKCHALEFNNDDCKSINNCFSYHYTLTELVHLSSCVNVTSDAEKEGLIKIVLLLFDLQYYYSQNKEVLFATFCFHAILRITHC